MGRGTSLFIVLFACTALAAQASAAPSARDAGVHAEAGAGQETSRRGHAPDIIVVGERLPGAVRGNVPPDVQLTPGDVAAVGAGTVAELVDELAAQTGGSTDPAGRPLVLVNGQRISGFSEIADLPPEAILRVDILPEEVALRYGHPVRQRVVNLVLRPNFHGVTAEATPGVSAEGARRSYQADLNIARLAPAARWSLNGSYQRSDALLESEREIAGGLGRFRTLLPQSDRFTANGSISRDLSPDIRASLNARFEARSSEARVGLPPIADAVTFDDVEPIARHSRVRSASAGMVVNGALGRWQWSLAGNYGRSRDVIETLVPRFGPASPEQPRDGLRSRSRTADVQLFAYGTLAALPAGDLASSFTSRFDSHDYRSRPLAAAAGAGIDLSRKSVTAQASLDIPLIARGSGAIGRLGDLSANLNLEISDTSDFGSLRTFGYGMRWAPLRQVVLNASVTHRETAPDMQALGEPPILTPNVRVFDFSSGETFDVARLDGGNPALLADDRRLVRVGLTVRPLPRTNLVVTANYVGSRTLDPVGSLAALIPEIEAAFPDRFLRDPQGRLVRIDARPLNFARADRDELKWGFSLFEAFGAPVPSPGSGGAAFDPRHGGGEDERRGRLQLSMHHSWRLQDRLLIREGMPRLDFLRGAAVGSRGGRPRHELEAQAGLYRTGLGLRLAAAWQGGTVVRGTHRDGAGSSDLSFSSRTTLNLRLFADLSGRPALVRQAPWLGGSRLSLEIDNLFNSRPRVRNEAGETPRGLEPEFLDPAGRSIRVSFRKLF